MDTSWRRRLVWPAPSAADSLCWRRLQSCCGSVRKLLKSRAAEKQPRPDVVRSGPPHHASPSLGLHVILLIRTGPPLDGDEGAHGGQRSRLFGDDVRARALAADRFG